MEKEIILPYNKGFWQLVAYFKPTPGKLVFIKHEFDKWISIGHYNIKTKKFYDFRDISTECYPTHFAYIPKK